MFTHLPPFQCFFHDSTRRLLVMGMAVFSILTLALLSPAVSAAKRIAFVVGIDSYDNLGADDQLDKPVHDATAISRTLGNLGYEVTEGINLTISEFDTKWQEVLNKTTSEDTLVFFYSGHGVEVDGENLLLPRDIPYFKFGRHKQFQRRSVSVSELIADLRTGDRQPPKVTVMILDACRDNPTIPPEFKTKGIVPQGGLAEIPKARGTFIMYAAAPGKVSLERLGPKDQHTNSVYTRTLLPLLKQSNLSIQDLAIKVREQVYAHTEEVAYEQLPEYTDGIIGRFCLAGCQEEGGSGTPPPLAIVPQRKLLQEIVGKDGAPMVLVPAGEFTKGSSNLEDNPPRKQFVKDFYIDKYEVTVGRYAKFLSQGSGTERIPSGWDDVDLIAHRNHPVAGTDYFDASFYCRWANKRLPTNAEWEKAARGTDKRVYPWGNQTPNETMTNFNKNYCVLCNVYDEKIASVGTFPKDKSPFGLFDMAGNVTEWVEEGNRRGGDWRTGWPSAAESMELARFWPSKKGLKNPGGNPDQGFRCAQDPP